MKPGEQGQEQPGQPVVLAQFQGALHADQARAEGQYVRVIVLAAVIGG